LSSRIRFASVALAGFGLAVVTELVQNLPIVGLDGEVTDCAGVLVGIISVPIVEPLARQVESWIWRKTTSQLGHSNKITLPVEEASRP
jgi:hypothetical protein